MKIAIDAGHGGTNTGTGGIKARYTEKHYTLLFAKALQKALKTKRSEEYCYDTHRGYQF
jgi:N-acetylmuramoyl-L-alanine amidase